MPKIVDHEQQKEKFALATISLIAQYGLEGVTMRAVAKQAGLSYGSLFHYFKSKDDLLMHAVGYSTSAQTTRVNDFSSRYSGLKALEQLLCDDVIINDSSRDTWMVWMTFLYKATLFQPFAEMNEALMAGWLDRISKLLRDAQKLGEISNSVSIKKEAMAIWALSSGIGQIGLLHPDTMPEQQQKKLISDYLNKLRE